MYESEFEAVLNNNEVLLKHSDLLKMLSDDRIMCVGYEQNGEFYLMECCDEYFYHDLTREDCIALSKLFHDIALAIPSANTQNINLIREAENGLIDIPVTKEENLDSKWWVRKPSEPNGFIV